VEVGWRTQVGGPIALITAARASAMFGTVVRRARTRYVGTPGVHVGLGTQAHTVVTNVCASIVTHEKDCVKFFQAMSPGICLEQYCGVGAACADAGAEKMPPSSNIEVMINPDEILLFFQFMGKLPP